MVALRGRHSGGPARPANFQPGPGSARRDTARPGLCESSDFRQVVRNAKLTSPDFKDILYYEFLRKISKIVI